MGQHLHKLYLFVTKQHSCTQHCSVPGASTPQTTQNYKTYVGQTKRKQLQTCSPLRTSHTVYLAYHASSVRTYVRVCVCTSEGLTAGLGTHLMFGAIEERKRDAKRGRRDLRYGATISGSPFSSADEEERQVGSLSVCVVCVLCVCECVCERETL